MPARQAPRPAVQPWQRPGLGDPIRREPIDRAFEWNNNGDVASIITNSGTVVVDTAVKYNGADSIRFDTTAAYRQFTWLTERGDFVALRFYVRIGGAPSVNQSILVAIDTAASVTANFRLNLITDRTLRLVDANGSFVGGTSSPLSIGDWHVVEVHFRQPLVGLGWTSLYVDAEKVTDRVATDLKNVAINRFRLGRPVNTATITSIHVDRIALNIGGRVESYEATVPAGVATEARNPNATRRPVIPGGCADTTNTNVKSSDDRFAMRFVPDASFRLYRILVGVVLEDAQFNGSGGAAPAELSGGRPGYAGGNGGTIRASLVTCNPDGTPNLSNVVAQEAGVNPVDRYVATKSLLGITGLHYLLYFTFDVDVTADTMYCVVFENTHASPLTNFYSFENPVTSEQMAGPNCQNTLTKFSPVDPCMGLDARECLFWSIDNGANWVTGHAVGGDTISDGMPANRPGGHIFGYFTNPAGSDIEMRLPLYAYLSSGNVVEAIQPFYFAGKDNAPIGARGMVQRVAVATTVTQGGGFSPSGSGNVVGSVSVTNLRTGVHGVTPPLGAGRQVAGLDQPVSFLAGDYMAVWAEGMVYAQAVDTWQRQAFNIGEGDWPVRIEGQGSGLAEVWGLPWPMFNTVAAPPSVLPTGLVHGRSLGAPQVSPQLRPSGQAHSRGQGAPAIFPAPTGLVHARGVGSPQVNSGLGPAGQVHARGQGGPQANPQLLVGSQAHSRTLGVPAATASFTLAPASQSHFRGQGGPHVSPSAGPIGLQHTRAQGSPSVGLAAARRLGTLTVAVDWVSRPSGLAHVRLVGSPTTGGHVTLRAAAQAHARVLGTPQLSARALPEGLEHERGQGDINPPLPASIVHVRGTGTPTLSTVWIARPSGGLRSRAVGAVAVQGRITLGPPPQERIRAQGTPLLSGRATPTGLSHSRQLGDADVNLEVLEPLALSRA